MFPQNKTSHPRYIADSNGEFIQHFQCERQFAYVSQVKVLFSITGVGGSAKPGIKSHYHVAQSNQ